VLDISKAKLQNYLGSPNYHVDLQLGFAPSAQIVVDEITPDECCCGVRHDKNHYMNLKDAMYFNVWNRGFVKT
jgi:hypothetical protein